MSQTMGDRIKALRDAKGWSQEDLARQSGCTAAYLGRLERWEENNRNPTIDMIKAIAAALEVNPIKILGEEFVSQSEIKTDVEPVDDRHEIPLLTGTVSAGDFTASCYGEWEGETIFMPIKSSKNKVAWRISGRSMEPKYLDGDIVIIDCGVQFSDGDDVIAENDHGVTIKQLRIFENGSVELRPLNPAFPTLTFKDESRLEILGVVVSYHRDVRKSRRHQVDPPKHVARDNRTTLSQGSVEKKRHIR